MTLSPNVVRVLTLVSGVLAIVLANVPVFNLPVSVQATVTAVGGALIAILAWLEHPTNAPAPKTSYTPPLMTFTTSNTGSYASGATPPTPLTTPPIQVPPPAK